MNQSVTQPNAIKKERSAQTRLTQQIKDKALALGFARVGIAPADDFADYLTKIEERMPDYAFLAKNPKGPVKGARPRDFLPQAQSIVCVAYDYSTTDYPPQLSQHIGRIYLSRTYTPPAGTLEHARLELLKDFLRQQGITVSEGADVPARAACARAGIVTFGKNNFAYAGECGSFVTLSTIVIDKKLDYDTPSETRPCPPDCHLCQDACPTGAIAAPGRMIPQRCLSFNQWFVQDMPEDIRQANGQRIYGCDACQTACPRNQKALRRGIKKDMFLERFSEAFDLEKVLLLDDVYYQDVIQPVMFNYIRNPRLFQRNAAIALGNTGDPAHIPALEKARDIPDELVQEAAAWAIERIQFLQKQSQG